MSANVEFAAQHRDGAELLGSAGRGIGLRSKVWLERNGQVVLSEWRVELLEATDEAGSLAQGAQKLGVPYRTAWYKLKEVEERLGIKLLDRQSGGVDGGGSRLTPEGRELVQRFRRAMAGVAGLADQRFRAELGNLFG